MLKALELKIPPPVVGLALAGLMWWLARVTSLLEVSLVLRLVPAVMLSTIGVAIAVAGVLAFHRAQTTVNPLKPESSTALVQSGVFRHSRNPMYLGLALVLVAWAWWLAAPLALIGPVLFVAWMNRFQIRPEERMLLRLFGTEYQAYRERVRRWV